MRQKRNKDIVIVEKNSHNNLLTGMFLGFATYVAFDLYRDEKKRKDLVKDLKQFSNEVEPYVSELKQKASENSEIKQAIKSLDSSLGIDLYDYIFSKSDSSSNKQAEEPAQKSTTNSIRRFFKLK